MPDIYLYFVVLRTQPLFNNWHVELDEHLHLRRLHLPQPLDLTLKGRHAVLSLEDLQVLLTCVGNSFVEQLVEVELVAGEEVHGACVEGEPKGLVGLCDWKDVKVKRIGDDSKFG